MRNQHFSFIVLTLNEELHLPRLLASIEKLNAEIFILDSGSTDDTLQIAESFGAIIEQHKFENHPKQWDVALHLFPVNTPWVIGLDADQIISTELINLLLEFNSNTIPQNINGIYFNRKNYFKGKWIRHGGYFPKYMLKMFRFGIGYSDLSENMDHRFVVDGETIIWKKGYLIEENLKENDISFWVAKHNIYSDLVAEEEIKKRKYKIGNIEPNLWGTPDERITWMKKYWRLMPLYIRPFIYFSYRYFIKLGFLDGKEGFVFHFLQSLWFRLLVDIKIDERLKSQIKTR